MRSSAGHHFLSLLGVLCSTVGCLAWIGLAWKAISGLDDVSAQSAEGGRLMTWAVSGTVLMIVGMVFLHLAQEAAERDKQEEHTPPR